jgi:hypothetical protein
VGKSVLAVPEFGATQEGTPWFRNLLYEAGGFVHVGRTLDEHLSQLVVVLERGDEHAEQTRRFVESFLRPRGLDQPAAPVLADEIEALAGMSPAHERQHPGAVLLRGLLAPAAALGSLVGRLRRRDPQLV